MHGGFIIAESGLGFSPDVFFAPASRKIACYQSYWRSSSEWRSRADFSLRSLFLLRNLKSFLIALPSNSCVYAFIVWTILALTNVYDIFAHPFSYLIAGWVVRHSWPPSSFLPCRDRPLGWVTSPAPAVWSPWSISITGARHYLSLSEPVLRKLPLGGGLVVVWPAPSPPLRSCPVPTGGALQCYTTMRPSELSIGSTQDAAKGTRPERVWILRGVTVK